MFSRLVSKLRTFTVKTVVRIWFRVRNSIFVWNYIILFCICTNETVSWFKFMMTFKTFYYIFDRDFLIFNSWIACDGHFTSYLEMRFNKFLPSLTIFNEIVFPCCLKRGINGDSWAFLNSLDVGYDYTRISWGAWTDHGEYNKLGQVGDDGDDIECTNRVMAHRIKRVVGLLSLESYL